MAAVTRWALLLPVLLAPGLVAGATAGRTPPLCFQADVNGTTHVVVLHVLGAPAPSHDLLAAYVFGGATFPAWGSARLRGDGRLDFGLATGGHTTPQRRLLVGRLDPATGTGAGHLVLDNSNIPASFPATFSPVPCPASLPDAP
jgi:hypothetical protein